MPGNASTLRMPLIALVAAMVIPVLSYGAPKMTPQVKPRARLAPAVQACLQLTREHLSAAATRNLSAAEKASLQGVVDLLKGGKRDAAIGQWKTLVRSVAAHLGLTPVDINTLVQYVIRESYLESCDDLADYADKVSYFNEAEGHLRASRNQLRGRKPPVTVEKLAVASSGTLRRGAGGVISPPLTSAKVTLADDAQIRAYIQRTEDQLRSVLGDAEQADVELQNALQPHQHTISTLSEISHLLTDTAMAVITNLK